MSKCVSHAQCVRVDMSAYLIYRLRDVLLGVVGVVAACG